MSYIGQGLPADSFQGFTTDSFTGDGSATTFTLSKKPFDESALLVVINNVVQKPTTNFTVSGTTLTIVGTAVASGDVIYATHIGGALPIGQAVSVDLNGASDQLILDADGDSTISADTDDQIDFKLGGVDEMTMSSSGIVINEGSNDRDFRIESDNSTHAFFVQGSNGVVGFGTSTLNTNFNVAGGAEFTTTGNVNNFRIISTDDGSATAPDIVFVRDSASPADGDFLGRVDFRGDDSAGNETNYISLFARANVVTDGSEQGALTFTDGDSGNSLLHIQNTAVIFNQDSIDTDFRVESNGNTHTFFIEGSTDNISMGSSDTTPGAGTDARLNIITKNGGQSALVCFNAGTGAVNQVSMENGNGQVGRIQTSGSATSYLTSSDYRLKENVDYTWDATTRLKQLKPARFNFIADETNTLVDGFLAHEVSSIVPEAISGEKDAMLAEVLYTDDDDEIPDGKKVGDVKRPVRINPQAIDQSKLVPLMVKTIQELEARIKTLEDS